MQFYLDGYEPGDPLVHRAHPSVAAREPGLPETADVDRQRPGASCSPPSSPSSRSCAPSSSTNGTAAGGRPGRQQGYRDVGVADLPAVLLPRKGRFGLVDHEKVFCPRPGSDLFDLRGVDRDRGCLVVVRPDQYVSQVLPLDAHAELADLLAGALVELR